MKQHLKVNFTHSLNQTKIGVFNMIPDNKGDIPLSTFCLEYRGANLLIVHSKINGVDYIGGLIESIILPTIEIQWSAYEDGLDDFISTFKELIDIHQAKRAINLALIDSD